MQPTSHHGHLGTGRGLTGVCFHVHFALTDFPRHIQRSGFYQHSTCSFLSQSWGVSVRKSTAIEDLYTWHAGETHRAWGEKRKYFLFFHSDSNPWGGRARRRKGLGSDIWLLLRRAPRLCFCILHFSFFSLYLIACQTGFCTISKAHFWRSSVKDRPIKFKWQIQCK